MREYKYKISSKLKEMKKTMGIIGVMGLLMMSCAKGNETKISTFHDNESHLMGNDCITCHVKDGGGEGWFTAAGTVYDTALVNTYPNLTIDLYSGINGTGDLIKTIEVDGKGNFYTTKKIDFTNGLYPTVTNETGVKQNMQIPTTSGACNSCHGVITDKIWAD